MALRASLGADFSEFSTALKNVEVQLKTTSDYAKNTGRDLTKMVEGFSGSKLFRDAELVAAAVTRIGGAAKLTEGEQRKVNATVTEAIAKYRALGQEVPQHLQKIADATKHVETSTSKLGSIISTAAGTFAGFLSAQTVMRGVSSAFSFAANAVVGMNATLETTTLQFATMMGDADKAKAHVKSLFEFGAKTPFETGPIIEASRYMRLFGGDALDTAENLKRVGDAAATSGKPINEVGMWVARLYSGLKAGQPVGEATQRLMELGVMSGDVRAKVTELAAGVEGGRGAWEYYSKELDKNNGAMEKMASTWEGVTSTLNDTITMTLATAFKPLFERFRDLIGQVNTIGGSTALQDWAARTAVQVDNLTISAVGFGASVAPVIGFIGTEFNAIQVLFRDVLQVIDLATLAVKGLALAALEAANAVTPTGAFMAQRQRLRAEMAELVIAIDQRKVALQEDKKAEEEWGAAGAKMAEQLKAVEARMRANQAAVLARTAATTTDTKATSDNTAATDTWATSTKKATSAAKAAEEATSKWLEAWNEGAREGRASVAAFQDSFKRLGGAIVQIIPDAGEAGKQFEFLKFAIDGVRDSIATKFLPLMPAIKGNLTGVAKAATTELGDMLDALGTVFDNINSRVGQSVQVMSGLWKVIGDNAKSATTKMVAGFSAASEVVNQLVTGTGRLATATRGAFAGAAMGAAAMGGLMAAEVITTSALTLGVGAVVAGLAMMVIAWNAAGSAARAANREADAKLAQLRTSLIETYGSLQQVDTMGQMLGVDLAGAWGDTTAAGLQHFAKLLDEFNAKLKSLSDAAQTFGFTWADMSGQMAEFFGGKIADNLIDQFDLLVNAGIGVEDVTKAMSGAINDYIRNAQEAGIAIPAAMQPIVDKMREMGLLGTTSDIAAQAGYKTVEDLQKIADKAKAVYDYMVASGKYSTAELAKAWKAYEDAAAQTLGGVATSFSAQMQALNTELEGLTKSVAAEAAEEVMGVVETQQRERIAQIEKEKAALAKQEAEAKAATGSVTEAAKHDYDKLFADVVSASADAAAKVASHWSKPPWGGWTPPSGGGAANGGAQASGGDYLVTRPTWFLAGEAGLERATFTPGGQAPSASAPIIITVVSQLDGKEVARNQVRYLPNQLALAGV